jgi:hypothetical protein
MLNKKYRAIVLFLSVAFALVVGCSKVTPSDEISVSRQSLEEEVATCQSTSQECLMSAGSLNGIQACRTAFTTCLKEAADQLDKTRAGLDACREQSVKCLQEADSAASVARCRTAQTECIAKITPSGDDVETPAVDAGVITPPDVTVPTIPGLECAQKAIECALSGKDPLTCADEARKCAMPDIPDGGIPGIDDLPTIPGLGDLPGADCLSKMRECVQAGEKDVLTCASEARTCMMPTIPDGGLTVPTIPGSNCRQALRDCLEAGTEPATCAEQARACIRQAPADDTADTTD